MSVKEKQPTPELPHQDIAHIIGDKRDEVLRLAAKNGVTNVRVFGSVARGEATPDSDIDFLADGCWLTLKRC